MIGCSRCKERYKKGRVRIYRRYGAQYCGPCYKYLERQHAGVGSVVRDFAGLPLDVANAFISALLGRIRTKVARGKL